MLGKLKKKNVGVIALMQEETIVKGILFNP